MLTPRHLVPVFAYLLTALFGLLLWAVVRSKVALPAEVFLFYVLFAASVGLVFKREWARKLMRATCVVGLIYFGLKPLVIGGGWSVAGLSMVGICGLIIYFYRGTSLEALTRGDAVLAGKGTVLVVDDDLTFVKLVKAHFARYGLNVISSESGERGLEMAKRWKPDMIILDVILPGMKGRAVCAKLKEDADTESIPVMFVTFKNSLDDISAEMELGAVMHLTKPVNYDQLYQEVAKILGKT